MIVTSLAENDPIKLVGFIFLSSPRLRTIGPNSEAADRMQKDRTARQPKIAHDPGFALNTQEFTPNTRSKKITGIDIPHSGEIAIREMVSPLSTVFRNASVQ
jgi:hypothetical protein